jgi:transposase
MQPGYRCLAGIDVHKKMLAVVVRQEQDGHTQVWERAFGTTRGEILHLAAWLGQQQVSEVVMESTAQYWRPVWYGLEAHFRLHLSHPLATRAPRGRKGDFRDARRLVDRLWAGDVEESFVPDAEQRDWRWLTRTRVELRRKIGVVRSQVEGLLEEGSIKLAATLSDLFGASGWAMLERLAEGETDAIRIASQARGSLRHKQAALQEALAGRLNPVGRLLLGQCLQQVRLFQQNIGEIELALSRAMREHTSTLQRLSQVPGIEVYAAQELLAEIGPGAVAFASAAQFASWVGVCPGQQESAGVSYSSRSPNGNRYLRRLLCQLGWAAARTQGTFFAGLFARLSPKLGAKAAAWAVAHRLARVIWVLLHRGVDYIERGPAPQNPRHLQRKFQRLVAQLSRAGIDPTTLLAPSTATLS